MSVVAVLKLKTSEEIIAEILDVDDVGDVLARHSIDVKNPIQIVLQAGDQGFGAIMLPWGSVEGDIHLLREDVIYAGTPKKDLQDKYERAFSVLARPSKSLLID